MTSWQVSVEGPPLRGSPPHHLPLAQQCCTPVLPADPQQSLQDRPRRSTEEPRSPPGQSCPSEPLPPVLSGLRHLSPSCGLQPAPHFCFSRRGARPPQRGPSGTARAQDLPWSLRHGEGGRAGGAASVGCEPLQTCLTLLCGLRDREPPSSLWVQDGFISLPVWLPGTWSTPSTCALPWLPWSPEKQLSGPSSFWGLRNGQL